jgi:hypothetical protein
VHGEGDVVTIVGNPLDLSLCGSRLAFLTRNAAGIRSAIRKRWALYNKQAAAQRDKRRAELEQETREDQERVAKMDGGMGGNTRDAPPLVGWLMAQTGRPTPA